MPLIGVVTHIFFGRVIGRKAVGILACVLVFISLCLSFWVFFRLLGMEPGQRHILDNFLPWIHVGKLKVAWAFRADTLSSVMALVVSGVGFLIHVYSTGYMHDDSRYIRFFAYMNLFTFAMLVLVLASNVLLMFIGWEGVGLCSYLLIGFWYEDINNAKAGMKAFIVNRVGDFSFLVGTLLLFWYCGKFLGVYTLDFYEINANAHLIVDHHPWIAVVVCLLFFGGATGKSAQVPLYVWLPDAMAGPTPVSALIHAATMVTAGVYMIARFSGLYLNAPEAMLVVASVGALTAIFAASIAFAQNDIKKVLAYSTVSQLGYMFLGVGVGAFQAGIFHLMTHAFFKGLLFLAAGSVIHGMHNEQDMRKMGALKSKMPYTWITFIAAWLAISGFPGFSGFFSKDEILWKAFSSPHGHWALWLVGFIAAGMTAFYMTRLIVMTFYGEKRWDKGVHPHESPPSMTVPLLALGVLSVVGGYVGVPALLKGSNNIEHWMHPAVGEWVVNEKVKVGAPHGESAALRGMDMVAVAYADEAEGMHEGAVVPQGEGDSAGIVSAHGEVVAGHGHAAGGQEHEFDPIEALLMAASVAVAIGGILFGWWMYTKRRDIPEKVATTWPGAYNAVLNKYYVDEIYDFAVIKNVLRISKFSGLFDTYVVDGIVNGSAWLTRKVANIGGWIDNNFVDGTVNAVAEITRGIGKRFSKVQTGLVQQYLTLAAAVVALAVVALILWPSVEPYGRNILQYLFKIAS